MEKFFQHEGTGEEQLKFFSLNSIRYGRVNFMPWAHEWAHEQGYSIVSIVWIQEDVCQGSAICTKAADYGQLLVLQ